MTDATVIAHGGLNLRKSPQTGRVIKSLRRSSKVSLLGEETWARVRARDGTVGWVLADHLEREPARVAMAETAVETPAESAAESDLCNIQPFHADRYIGNEIRADVDFQPHLRRVNEFAAACEVRIHVTSSAREPGRTVSGAIVAPAGRSNHLVGHAIDMNIQSASGFFNSSKLKRANFARLPRAVKAFIEMIRDDSVLRWGGDFSKEDPVHIDDGLNIRDPDRWDRKLASRA